MLLYLVVVTTFLIGNSVADWQAAVLFVLYICHVFLMKYNAKYEVAIKKSVAKNIEVKELNRIAKKNIGHFHRNLQTRALSIEMLNKISFRLIDDTSTIVFDNYIKRKLNPIYCVKLGEERFATPDNR